MKYCTYILKDPTTDTPFYIGSGKLSRPYYHMTFNKYDTNYRKLDKLRELIEQFCNEDIIEIVEESDSRDEMFSLEQSYLDEYRVIEDGGILLNLQKVVECGFAGRKHTEETKCKISDNNVGMTGMKHSEETKRKISEAQKRRWQKM